MIVKIMVDIKHFLMVMVVLIMAFAMSFTALGDGMVVSLFWVINTGLFQLTPPPDFDAALGSYTDTVTHTKILFLILMVMVALILLNLLIAIMNQTYEDVRRVAALEVAGQKSRIILDIERFMLPVFMDLLDIKLSMIFPRWLHVLVPITMMDEASNGQRRRALAQANAGRQRHDGRS